MHVGGGPPAGPLPRPALHKPACFAYGSGRLRKPCLHLVGVTLVQSEFLDDMHPLVSARVRGILCRKSTADTVATGGKDGRSGTLGTKIATKTDTVAALPGGEVTRSIRAENARFQRAKRCASCPKWTRLPSARYPCYSLQKQPIWTPRTG